MKQVIANIINASVPWKTRFSFKSVFPIRTILMIYAKWLT